MQMPATTTQAPQNAFFSFIPVWINQKKGKTNKKEVECIFLASICANKLHDVILY